MTLSNKSLWILTGIIGAIFLMIVISLAIADKIKTGALIVFIIIIVLLVFIIDLTFHFIRKGGKISVEKEGSKIKVIDLDTAKELAKEMIMGIQYTEYERECIYEDVWHTGESKTPVYVRLIKGEFDGNLLGAVINMENQERRGIKEYKESEITPKEILVDMERRANFLALSPRPTPSHEEEIIERPGGERVTRTRTLAKGKEEVPEKKGDLQ